MVRSASRQRHTPPSDELGDLLTGAAALTDNAAVSEWLISLSASDESASGPTDHLDGHSSPAPGAVAAGHVAGGPQDSLSETAPRRAGPARRQATASPHRRKARRAPR